MPYQENPKTAGSGVICCIPQTGHCPVGCKDCFFQSGRSYLEPLADNLPNMPELVKQWQVVRVNDGNDSNINRDTVVEATRHFPNKFYNTSIPQGLDFPGPVVLTLNPAVMTDKAIHKLAEIPPNLMFVRFRANTWNDYLGAEAVRYYTEQGVPVVFTFMAYHDSGSIRDGHFRHYTHRRRTPNAYWAIKHAAWRGIMFEYLGNPLVHSCGTEGVSGGSACKNCGNCLREYAATMERLKA